MTKQKIVSAINTVISYCEDRFEARMNVGEQIEWHHLMISALEIAQRVKEDYALEFDTEK